MVYDMECMAPDVLVSTCMEARTLSSMVSGFNRVASLLETSSERDSRGQIANVFIDKVPRRDCGFMFVEPTSSFQLH